MSEKIPFKDYQAQLSGSWKLFSYLRYKDGQVIAKPHGDNPLGYVQISPEGYLSAHLANPARIKPPHPDRKWDDHSDAEIADYYRSVAMYCGQMQLFRDAEGLFWKTKVDIASDPTRIGGEQLRRVTLGEEDGIPIVTLQPVNAEFNQVCVRETALLRRVH